MVSSQIPEKFPVINFVEIVYSYAELFARIMYNIL